MMLQYVDLIKPAREMSRPNVCVPQHKHCDTTRVVAPDDMSCWIQIRFSNGSWPLFLWMAVSDFFSKSRINILAKNNNHDFYVAPL